MPERIPTITKRLPLAMAFLLLAGQASCGAGSEDSGPPQNDAVRIVAQRVHFERRETRVEAVGTARAAQSAVIFPETSGEAAAVMFRAGERVRQGAPLVRLESREEDLAVRLAQVAVQEAEQMLARYRRIEGTGAISASQIDEGRTALDAAEIQLEQAEVALAERTIRAPFAGHVGLTDVDPGVRVSATTEITRIDDRSKLLVDFAAPEQVFGRVSLGDFVETVPFAEGNAPMQAKVVAIDSRIDPERRTFTVRAEIENTNDMLRPGMSFRVSFALSGEAYPSVPEAAIVWGNDGSFVWRAIDEQAVRTPVEIISRGQGSVLVSGRLPEGSLIIAEGVQKVREGTPVIVSAPVISPAAAGRAGP